MFQIRLKDYGTSNTEFQKSPLNQTYFLPSPYKRPN